MDSESNPRLRSDCGARQVGCAQPDAAISIGIRGAWVRSDGIHFDDGTVSRLSSRESRLLRYFVENAGRVVTRDELLKYVWEFAPTTLTRTIDMHVAFLRRKLRDDPSEPFVLLTAHGEGYVFLMPEHTTKHNSARKV
jgi:DNA-binding response OmpR family regulator